MKKNGVAARPGMAVTQNTGILQGGSRQAGRTDTIYPISMTSCIAASCRYGSADSAIVLCSDRRVDYGSGYAANEAAWKISAAGPGWMALMAGPTSRCKALLSLYWRHLIETPPLTDENAWSEMQIPLNRYKESLRSHKFPGDKSIELLLTGFIGGCPRIFKVAVTESDDDEAYDAGDFACIGSGSSLSHGSLMNRIPNSSMQADEALYYVYEAKRWSELETGVNKHTAILIQRVGQSADGMIIERLRTGGQKRLADMYRRFGPQRFQSDRTAMSDIFFLTPEGEPYPQPPTGDPIPPPPSQE